MIRRLVVAAAFCAGFASLAGVTTVVAQSNPIAERQQLMKNLSQAARAPGGMLKGEVPFDLAAVQTTLKTFADVATKAPALFPDNSKTGNDTAALPKVWTDKADFNGLWTKFEKDAVAAQASIKDEASFKAAFPVLMRSCGGCHEGYRAKKG
ncbi:MAG: cytochrome c [Beijerinckiaceae bacterium]|jgi:cytochrome c556|nr:cytochrome c [Beijerinckiaceae bacterium]MBX9759668.1 cytochrome c [Beijerinckiaceae bacterium]MDO9441518.1 cytochrome c [Beijerinckiaceae bacterium]